MASPDGAAEELPVKLPVAAARGVAAGEGVAAELGVDADEGAAALDGAAEELSVELPVAATLDIAAGEGVVAKLGACLTGEGQNVRGKKQLSIAILAKKKKSVKKKSLQKNAERFEMSYGRTRS
jgi:hypothetical protein